MRDMQNSDMHMSQRGDSMSKRLGSVHDPTQHCRAGLIKHDGKPAGKVEDTKKSVACVAASPGQLQATAMDNRQNRLFVGSMLPLHISIQMATSDSGMLICMFISDEHRHCKHRHGMVSLMKTGISDKHKHEHYALWGTKQAACAPQKRHPGSDASVDPKAE